MKARILFTTLVIVFGAGVVFGANKTEKIEVKGNCGMCETRIEKAALTVDGVSKADWDKTTKKLKVTFDDAKTSIDNIETAVAKVGHDTPKHKAADEVYNELPGCCKYRDKNAKTH
jgi:copper chaperone CopZ